MATKYLDHDGLLYLWGKFKPIFNGKLDKSGGTMTGKLTLDGAPTSNLHAATKKYVDDNAGGATITAGTTDLTPGTSTLATGTYYAYYE